MGSKYDWAIPAPPLPMGLLSQLGGPPPPGADPSAPLPPTRTGPPAPPQDKDKPGFKWTPEAVMKAQEELAKQFGSKPIVPMFGKGVGTVGPAFANAANGFMSTYPITQAQSAAEANERMRQEAVKSVAGATDLAGTSNALMNSNVPDLQSQGLQARIASQKAREDFEFQKRLALELKDSETKQMLDRLRAAGALPPQAQAGQPAATSADPATAPAAPTVGAVESPAAPAANPNAAFANDLLSGQGPKAPSPLQKFGINMALGEKGKAADALTEKGDKLTEQQTKDASFSERLLRSEVDLRQTIPTDKDGKFSKYDPTGADLGKFWWLKGIPGTDHPFFSSDNWLSYKRAAGEGIAAMLYKDSGAQVPDSEFNRMFTIYYPQPGDPPRVIQEKQQARVARAKGLRNSSGPAFDQMYPTFDNDVRTRLLQMGADLTPREGTAAANPKGAAPAPAPSAAPQGGAAQVPDVGEVRKGYRFKGGNPADQGSWEKVAQ